MNEIIANILSPIKNILDYFGKQPGTSEQSRIILAVSSATLYVTIQIAPIVIPEPSIRLSFIFIIFLVSIVSILIILQRPKFRRWLLYLVPLAISAILFFGTYAYTFFTSDSYRVAPTLMSFGKPIPYTAVYGTNAKITEPTVYKSKLPIGPNTFIRLRFQLVCKDLDEHCNAGWILANLQGIENQSSWNYIAFEIRGAYGNEVVGITLKDYSEDHTEERIFDIKEYLEKNSIITTDWSTVRIPLTHFGRVEIANLDVISFFVDGRYSPYEVTDVDLSNIRFEN